LMETFPIYSLAIKDKDGNLEICPYFNSPLSLFAQNAAMKEEISKEYNIPERSIQGFIGPWENKRLKEFDGDVSRFLVVRLFPSRTNQMGITVVEPGDENTQDVSVLSGKVDVRKLEFFQTSDTDAYQYSGGLNKTTQGMMEFREMFKAKIKMLNPLLFAIQEHNYQPTENFGALPYYGITLAHSNEAEWDKFRNNKDNEAFLDRVCIIKVPYVLRTDEEEKIYGKVIKSSQLHAAPVAPGTLRMLAQFAVLSRLNDPKTSRIESKMKVYNGENLKEKDPSAKTFYEYHQDIDNRREGFTGISTRWASKVLSEVFNQDPKEVGADPVHLLYTLKERLKKSDLKPEEEERLQVFIRDIITKNYREFLDKEIRKAYLESYKDFGQNLFDKYVMWATSWVDDQEYMDKDTGIIQNKEQLNSELEKIEKAADIVNEKDFRNEIVRYVLRYNRDNGGKNPDWRSYEKLRNVIEKRMFAKTDELLPVISFNSKGTEEEKKKHNEFVQHMRDAGYTDNQIRRVVEWYIKSQNT